MRPTRAILALLSALLLPGCAGPDAAPAEMELAADRYDAAFDAAREVLRDYRFEIDRVDARAGVISTRPKPTAGLATPWDREQQSLRQEWEDFANQQQRVVRIVFEPASARVARERGPVPQAAPGPPRADLRTLDEPLSLRIEAVVERINRPHHRVETEALGASSFATEPALRERGMQPTYAVARDRDRAFEAALLRAIERRLERAGAE